MDLGAGAGCEEEGGATKEHPGILRFGRFLDCDGGFMVCTCVKRCRIVHFRVQFIMSAVLQ